MVIYKITNLINKKIYVGQTKQKIEVVEHCKNQNELNEYEKIFD